MGSFIARSTSLDLDDYWRAKAPGLRCREYGIAVFAVEWDRRTEEYPGMNPATHWTTPVDLSGWLCIALASGWADRLTGRRLIVRQDIDALVQQAEQIAQNDLYVLRPRPSA